MLSIYVTIRYESLIIIAVIENVVAEAVDFVDK